MSAEQTAIETFTNIGNILSIIVTVTLIIGAVAALVRFLRAQVARRVDLFSEEVKGTLKLSQQK